MSPRTGRPRTGHTPNISRRINPDAYHAARIEAVTVRKTVGQWIEEAINEKIEREREQKMSLRQIAKELEISPAYLSYMINGKRLWRKDLYQRYMGVVNKSVNSEAESVNNSHDSNLDVTQKMAIKKAPFERDLLKIAIGAEDEIRTRDFLLGKEVLYH